MKKITFMIYLLSISISFSQSELKSSLDQYFDSSTSTWQNNYGQNFNYDANSRLSSIDSYFWNGSQWEPESKSQYTYSSTQTIFTDQVYNTSNSSFENDYRTTINIDGNGDFTTLLDEYWDGNQWVVGGRLTYSYDSGRISQVLFEEWDNVGMQWQISDRGTLTYNTNGNVALIETEEYINGAFTQSDREIQSFNSNGYIISSVLEIWNSVSMSYVEDQRREFTIDGNGNRLSSTDFYDGTSYTENYNYDFTELMSDYANPFVNAEGLEYITSDFPFYNKITSVTSNSNTNRILYNYEDRIALSTDDLEIQNDVKIFPNPTSSVLNIQTNKIIDVIEIYDVFGKRISQTNQKTINTSHLSSGIYMIKISNIEGQSETKKFIKH
ncbi:T9SS type A sorting domain-containing protein [Winogradskyella bathintestinalis]|uniref:T9SS type A sorting domain-containing protein n=1 Tax=Winogradskyella bathintestinalis TaxID=3035208 RepID=A0ABT7ZW83_9FLAO|nr:T9SS type A sorting domain-containing protein [Winogradskyella bathintestinalis]MDN3493266.1 T9SS type A sorting domain-containing protein [Winogradskyella bathintestinalis]